MDGGWHKTGHYTNTKKKQLPRSNQDCYAANYFNKGVYQN